MKKLLSILLICLLACPAALAAEWAEGRSAAQPYEGVPEVNLSESMGYAIRFPRDKAPASVFCDVLQIWLPREDIVRGAGNIVLHHGEDEETAIDFADEKYVTIQPLDESMLSALRWGGGTCISVQLPVSLRLGEDYYITMDEGCFRTVDGDIPSPAIMAGAEERWVPTFSSDYAISGLYYSAALEQEEPEAAEEPAEGEAAETEEAAAEETAEAEPEELEEVGETILISDVKAGDKITFDLVLGGDATVAVIFSDNGSASFQQSEYNESQTIRGTVTNDELNWGVVFLDNDGNVVNTIIMKK